MANPTASLPLGDILSVTTGALVSRDHMDGIYRVCDFMTQDSNFTHQLPRVAEAITPLIFEQHPELADVQVSFEFPDHYTSEQRSDAVFAWLAEQEKKFGASLTLEAQPDRVGHINPFSELASMLGGTEKIVPVVVK